MVLLVGVVKKKRLAGEAFVNISVSDQVVGPIVVHILVAPVVPVVLVVPVAPVVPAVNFQM
jgi:hypothetical protein